MEKELSNHYGWPVYWDTGPMGTFDTAGSVPLVPIHIDRNIPLSQDENDEDVHLRSLKEVEGYHIKSVDGEIGHTKDLIIDDERWVIRYMIVDTRNILPGKKVIIAPDWIKWISWYKKKVSVLMSKELVKNSPVFDPSLPVNRKYEEILYDFYGRPKYWE